MLLPRLPRSTITVRFPRHYLAARVKAERPHDSTVVALVAIASFETHDNPPDVELSLILQASSRFDFAQHSKHRRESVDYLLINADQHQI